MGKRGPRPQPTKLKLLRGNPGRRPVNENEPNPAAVKGCPAPPEWLLPEAAAEWNRLAPELQSLGLLTVLDLNTLARFCQCWAHYRAADQSVIEQGRTLELKSKEGTIKSIGPNPNVAIAMKMADECRRLGSMFGLDPSSRSLLGVETVKPSKLNAFRGAS